jgi:hypothetical protein
MTILIDLSVAGVNTGPFNLYSDADGYTSAFATNITRQQLLDGYPAVVAAGTTNIKLQSLSDICPNDTILPVSTTTSTTSTSTSTTSTTSTTTTSTSSTTTTTTTASALLICGIWNSITQPQTYYDENDNPVTYQLLVITGGSQFDFYKLILPGEIINTAASTVKVLSYTAQTATNLIANSSELPAPDPQWEDVLFETTDNNTIYKYSVALNIWVSVPYGQETTTYNVDPVTWQINFDYTPPYIGTIGDPLASESPSRVQNTNIHPVLTMTLGGNLVTTDGRVIPINYTSTYTSILQEFESESNDCQNFRPTTTSTTTTAPPEAGITLSVSNTSAALACALYGDPGNEVYYYLDDPIWYISTGLYQNPQETLFAPGGFWYCDGVYARLWGGTEFVGLPVEC